MSCDANDPPIGTDCRKFHSNNQLVNRGMQTAVMDNRSIGEVESELDPVKEKLRATEDTVAYLSDKMGTYRYKWLEEYYCAENLECHMPYDVCVPHPAQIAEGAPSPAFSPEFLEWDGKDEA
ncbi:uncharacterized protein F5147DRAFT_658290 [Suillus discolor]|uniref:Uncharacterized protein n=1 Tax=Suillus discolor TaxID=1912936 RepID=A0A9P7JMK4_9AGAM|nr:uncharacterized protein F5147DRAFT_658290 [Suillus discolor]KAG2090031.1 hypothetical protein F5147DRAFT_658290 [Suillus discolor]